MDGQAVTQKEVELSFEEVGQRKYLKASLNGHIARERIPLHIWDMVEGEEKMFLMKDVVTKVKRKMHRLALRSKWR